MARRGLDAVDARRLLQPGSRLEHDPVRLARGPDAANGQGLLADSLARYDYLPNPANTNGLPVVFTVSGPVGAQIAGMTCAACHTRQITVAGVAYHIDGGPAIADFQRHLSDLDSAGNRLTGPDLGPAPNFLIACDINTADAPVRYRFLRNAPRQDRTRWPGFADNGNDILGLSPNLGEVGGGRSTTPGHRPCLQRAA